MFLVNNSFYPYLLLICSSLTIILLRFASKLFTKKDGRTGWYFLARDGNVYFTEGQPSRPFMYETATELRELIVEVAKEVFGGASE